MMFLSLILTIHIIDPLNAQEILMRYKITKMKSSLILLQKWSALKVFNSIFSAICVIGVAVITSKIGLDMSWAVNIGGVVGFLLTFGALSAIALWIGMSLKQCEAYGLFLFLIALIQAFLVGGLLPSAFMPETINNLGYLTYNKYAIGLLSNLIGIKSEATYYIGAGVIITSSLLLCCILMRKRGISL